MSNVSDQIKDALRARFPNNGIAPSHYADLLIPYAESGIAGPNLASELLTGDDGKFWSCAWEAMLFTHLQKSNFVIKKHSKRSGQNGPDFCLDNGGHTIWIEAVVPSPIGIPSDYLSPPLAGEIRVKTKPDTERVLRCTTVIADKKEKFLEYVRKGIVQPDDCTVIAINICRLSDWDIDGNGLSQLPLAMEAVFPIGPLAVAITQEGNHASHAENVARFSVQKASGVNIQTHNFLDPAFEGIGAILQGYQKNIFERPLILYEIHNPLANAKLPERIFGAYKEFLAEAHDDHYEVRDIASKVGV